MSGVTDKYLTRRNFFKNMALGTAAATVAGSMSLPGDAQQPGNKPEPPPADEETYAEKMFRRPGRDMIIDVFCHFSPPQYVAAFGKKNPKVLTEASEFRSPATTKIETRLRLLDRTPGVVEVLTISNPPMDVYLSPADAAEIAQIGNDSLAELVQKYPDKFLGAIACLPMNNLDAALKEADRALTKLQMKGIQIATRVNKEPMEPEKYKPLWERMNKSGLPVFIHPYTNETLSPDGGRLSWPYDTAATMFRIVYANIFQEYPNIKFITHHCGSMVPYFGNRVGRTEDFRKFYADTAIYGNTDGLMLGYKFFGVDHILFGTDFGPVNFTWRTIDSVEKMSIPEADKRKIFTDNTLNLLRLSV